MEISTNQDIRLGRNGLKGRTFLLGNKRAFSLSLPVASGHTDTLLHPHKWFGAYLYGRKFLEGQVLRIEGQRSYLLSSRNQVGFTMGLTSARRDYAVDDCTYSEQFFVPDGIQGIACRLEGDLDVAVEPELDMRLHYALNHSTDTYEVEEIENGVLVSNILPVGVYDDASESFMPSEDQTGASRIHAAVQVVGEGAWMELLPPPARPRRKLFRKDQQRYRFLAHSAPSGAMHDHAPLWAECASRVYAPARFHVAHQGLIVYGFGSSREEAIAQLAALRDSLVGYQAQKTEATAAILDHAHFETGSTRVDSAYAHVLARLTDTLVARNVTADDTALDRPATMILAGNQYFHDSWKRDENIALGFLLSLGFYDLARDVIRDTWQLQDEATGRLPQRIRAGEEPAYHSSDGTLWALWRLYQYWRCTGDDSILYDKLPMVAPFFRRSLERTIDGMLPSGRTNASEYLWETWMDTAHTPRDGFPIEIQMLWIACLRVYRPLVEPVDAALEQAMAAAEASAWSQLFRFNVRGMLADSLDSRGQVRDLITPNPFFCFGVGLDLGPEVERRMREVGRRQLAGRQGIRTLAPDDWGRVFPPEFLMDRRRVRGRRMRSIGKFNYHRGVEWNWLSQFFVEAELKYGEPDSAFRRYLCRQVDAALDQGGVGGISELFDLNGTRGPEFQAWSMSGFLQALHAFAGVHIDVPGRTIRVEPQLPGDWPQLSVRKWYGSTPLDVNVKRDGQDLMLQVDFPWGDVPDASLDVALVLPARHTIGSLDVSLDGTPHVPSHREERIPGSGAIRIVLTLPMRRSIAVKLSPRRTWGRTALTA